MHDGEPVRALEQIEGQEEPPSSNVEGRLEGAP